MGVAASPAAVGPDGQRPVEGEVRRGDRGGPGVRQVLGRSARLLAALTALASATGFAASDHAVDVHGASATAVRSTAPVALAAAAKPATPGRVAKATVAPRDAAATPLTRQSYADLVKLNPGYPADAIPRATLDRLTDHETPGTPGEMTNDESGTGFRPEIGARAYAAQVWATTFDPKARAHMLAEADLSKRSFPIHDTLVGAGTAPPKPWLWSPGKYDGRPFQRVPDPLHATGIHYDIAHAPAFVFDACMLMGFEHDQARFDEYLTELKWTVSNVFFDMMASAPNYAQGTKGLFNSQMGQQRAAAWALRNLDDLLLALETFAPDDEWLPWVTRSYEENIRFLDGTFRTGKYDTLTGFAPYADYAPGSFVNDFGITTNANIGAYGKGGDGMTAIIAPWQQGFHSHIISRGYRRQHRSVSPQVMEIHRQLALWTGRFATMMFGKPNDPESYDYRDADRYLLAVGRFRASQGVAANGAIPRAIVFFTTPAEFHADLKGLPPLGPDDHVIRGNNSTREASGFAGSFADDLVPALTEAVEVGTPGAAEAFARLEGSRQYREIGGDLAFAYLPKGKQYPGRKAVAANAAAVTPPASPKAGYAPKAPTIALAGFDPTRATKAADEGRTFVLTSRATVWYGAGGRFTSKLLEPGSHTADNATFGDPAPAIPKSVWVNDPRVVAQEGR